MLAGSSKGYRHRPAQSYQISEEVIEALESTLPDYNRQKYRPTSSEILVESKICKEWKLGRCNKGEKCRFRHRLSADSNRAFPDESGRASSRKLKEPDDYATMEDLSVGDNNVDDPNYKHHPKKSEKGVVDNKGEQRNSQNYPSPMFVGVLMTLLALEQIRRLVFKGRMEDERKSYESEIVDTQRRLEMFDDLGKTRREQVAIEKHDEGDSNTRGVERTETKRWVEEEEFDIQKNNSNRMLDALGRQGERRRLSVNEPEGNLERKVHLQETQVGHEPVNFTSTILQYIVLECNLVTCGPGLEIIQITPGYDLCQVSLRLPIETTGTEITEMLLEEGLDASDFHILRIEESGECLEVIILTNLRFGLALERNGEAFSNRTISFEVWRDAIWTSGTMGPDKPTLMLTWDSGGSLFSGETSDIELAAVYDSLFELEGARMETCCLVTPDSERTVDRVMLTVEFDNLENAMKAEREIQSNRPTSIPSFQVKISNSHQQSIVIPLPQYEVQRRQWEELSHTDNDEGRIEIEIDDEVTIRVHGNKAVVGALKVRIEKLARGEVLVRTYWHPSFASSEESASFFSDIMENATVYLKCLSDIHTLVLYGEPDNIAEARRMIQTEVSHREKVITRTALTGPSIGFFENGGVQKLKDLVGEANVNLKSTSRWSAITMRGGETATHHLRRLIKESLVEKPIGLQDPTTCPICFEEQTYPEMLECGHGYCSGCLNLFLKAAAENQKFPIVCVGDGATCNVPVSLSFIHQFSPHHAFQHLVEAAYATYLQKNPTQFRYCKTPDCKQTYRQQSVDEAIAITCPSCFAKTCSFCSEDHENMTCAEYRISRDPEEQERLNNELADTSGYKRCPRCAVWIEKTAGCNHMTCRCGAHICWICLGIFALEEIYEHLPTHDARLDLHEEAQF